MARQQKKSKGNASFSTTFVRCELTEADRKKVGPWTQTKDFSLEDLINQALGEGHKVSLSFNDNTDSYIASVTGKPEDCVNASKCYTSHAKTWYQALQVAMYKYHVIFRGEAWEDVGEENDFG